MALPAPTEVYSNPCFRHHFRTAGIVTLQILATSPVVKNLSVVINLLSLPKEKTIPKGTLTKHFYNNLG
jgi:hypothetical protein